MRKNLSQRIKVMIVVVLTIFSLSSTMVPTTALDLGAKGTYIISVTPSAKAAIEAAVTKNGWKIESKYNYVFDGYTVELPKLVAGLLSKIPNVLTVEEDKPVMGLAIQNTQTPTPAWGLDRVDQREKVGQPGALSSYGYRSAGAGSTIYIGDTGILPHSDFAGRLSNSGFSAINDGNGTVDCNGHGTHVAGTAAGTKFGLAKNAKLVPVRLLDCSGSGRYSRVISALDWILSPENPNSKTQAVLNLSIGGPASAALNEAILRLTNAGITVVVAAGNESTDACTRSPASAPSAITVGATNSLDAPAGYSNQGKCVDIFAPGSGIDSAWIGGVDATYSASGTSMASPHVAGAAAIYLGLNPTASVAQVAQYLDAESTKDAITVVKAETVNKLLYVSPTDGGAPVVAPVVAQRNVSNITHQSADVLIDVNPGFAPTTLSFEYSTSAAFSETATATVVPGLVDGGVATTASVKLTGLTASKTYHFRVIGVNESGRTVSAAGSFTTLAPPATLPIARIGQATNVTAYSVTLNGVAQAGNAPTNITFMYGTDPDFKVNTKTVAAGPFELSGGTNFFDVSSNISFIDGGKKYYFKLVAVNSTGTVHSPVATFDTPVAPGLPPVVTSQNSAFSKPNMEVIGTVHPQGQTTTVRLVVAQDNQLKYLPRYVDVVGSPFTGMSVVNVSALTPTLTPGIRYYYAFEATNASGVTKSAVRTNVLVSEARLVSNSIAALTSSSVQLRAIVNAGGTNTRNSFIWGTDPALATGAEVNGNPFALTSGVDTNVTATLAGLKPATVYYYKSKIVSYTGPFIGTRFGTINTFTTPGVVVTPTPTPTPVVPGVDKVKPVIISGYTTPQILEVCQTVKEMSVRASDNIGITTVSLRIYNENNVLVSSATMYRTTGNAQAGTWANDWAIPCNALIGKYRASVQATDAAGNTTGWSDIPNFWVMASTVQDKAKPVFVSGSVSPGPITVGQTIPEMSARFTDDIGISTVTFLLTDPKGATVATIPGMRGSGTKADGIWRNDWATKTSYVAGRYSIWVDAIDEWQKNAGLKLVGSIDLNPVPVVAPAPAPAPVPGDAAMVVTPYYSLSTSRTGALYSAAAVNMKTKSSALFVASTLFANGQNSGLKSLGHLLEVTTTTPAICSVTGVETWDRTGGIYTRANVNAIAAGTCTVVWKFLGVKGRAATSTTMNVKVN